MAALPDMAALGRFDPRGFEDRYEAALAEMVRAKMDGRRVEPPKPRTEDKVVDLMEALRQSAGAGAPEGRAKAEPAAKAGASTAGTPAKGKAAAKGRRAAASAPRRKAG